MNTPSRCPKAFTLIELLAVVLVIVLLAGITLGVSGYIQKRMGIATTRSQIAAMEAALESYKSDNGYYPMSSAARISASGRMESANNWILYRALTGASGGKSYLSFPAGQIRTNTFTQLPNIYDAWGHPFNYYNSPSTAYAVITTNISNYGYTLGGQVNVTGFDLFSYGSDGYTFAIPNAAAPPGWQAATAIWNKTNAAVDDVTNWGQ